MSDHFTTLCVRKLSGEATPAEAAELDGLMQDADNRRYFDALEQSWSQWNEAEAPPIDLNAAHDRFMQKVKERQPIIRAKAFPWMQVGLWAAIFAVIFALGQVPWSKLTREDIQTRITRAGEKGELLLPDGTRVTLNAGSTLSYPKYFKEEARIVHLEGEAFFQVTRDEQRPFIVEASGVRTKVLGTKFNVNAFSPESAASVSLVEGKVEVSALSNFGQASVHTLRPGEEFRWNPRDARGEVGAFDRAAVLGWLHGALVFRDESLDSIVIELERHFGIKVQLSDPAIGQTRMSLHFEKEPLNEIAEVIAFTGNLKAEVSHENGMITQVLFKRP